MSGKKLKVIRSQNPTQSRIVCQYSTDTTTEPSHNHKVNSIFKYYKKEWPAIVGGLFGTTLMLLTFYFAALIIYGDK